MVCKERLMDDIRKSIHSRGSSPDFNPRWFGTNECVEFLYLYPSGRNNLEHLSPLLRLQAPAELDTGPTVFA
jgi:hypothetical protein